MTMSFTYTKNKSEFNTYPCGTPEVTLKCGCGELSRNSHLAYVYKWLRGISSDMVEDPETGVGKTKCRLKSTKSRDTFILFDRKTGGGFSYMEME